MKKLLVILVIVVLGVALGVGVATLRIKATPWNPALDEGEPAARPSSQGGDKHETKAAESGHRQGAARFANVE
jgi:hypothetical protein